MAAEELKLARLEGGVTLTRTPQGRIRIAGAPSREYERRLQGRNPQDAIYLTQLISADSGVTHGLAAVTAWEAAAGISVAENGRLLRELLHALSLLHAHLRQFYLQALPDYLPLGSLAGYTGNHPHLQHISAELSDLPASQWVRVNFEHPFSGEEQERLWEHRALAFDVLVQLQQMMAVVGGKFPVAMSLVPGGVNLRLSEGMLIRLRHILNDLRSHLEETVLDDGDLVVRRYPSLRGLARGAEDFVSTGSGEDALATESALFPSGILLADKLEPFTSVTNESIARAFYDVPAQANGAAVPAPAPDKAQAYSWIKAPRYQGRPLEAGGFARLLIANLSGVHMWNPDLVDDLERQLGTPLRRGNTVAGRLLARLGELGGLVGRVEVLLDQLDPGHDTVSQEGDPFRASGEGFAHLEAPAGALQHRTILERGRIVHYDIISPSTWNGSPQDERDQAGPLETALNRASYDLTQRAQQRTLARIVHSFSFSMSDATH